MTPLKQRERDVTRALLEKQIISNATRLPAVNNFDKEKKEFQMVRDDWMKTGEELEEGWRHFKSSLIFDLIEDRGLKPAFAIKRSRTMFSYLVNNFRDQFYFFIVKR